MGAFARAPRLPQRVLLGQIKHMRQAQHLINRPAHNRGIAHIHEVRTAQIEGIPALAACDDVQRGFDGEKRLWPAKTALRPARNILGLIGIGLDVGAGHLVATADAQTGKVGDIGAQVFTPAPVKGHFCDDGLNFLVIIDVKRSLNLARVPFQAGLKLLIAVQFQTDRFVRRHPRRKGQHQGKR